MLDLFKALKSVIKRREIVTDNAIFRLHYLLTTMILVGFSLIITARQYVGEPIDCILSNKDSVSYINTYCWIHATFAMPDAFHGKVGEDIVYPGVGTTGTRNANEKLYYSYYQWVCFVLFFQAIFFYVPRYLWKMWEGGLMRTLTTGFHFAMASEEDCRTKKKVIIEYLQLHATTHTLYALKYFFCELLCLINTIVQMYLLDKFIGNEFWTFGLKVIEFSEQDQENRTDPMIYVFPRMTKCNFHKFGPSGDIQRLDALCVLPLNIVNEKIFIFLWFWLIILTILTAIVIVYRIAILALPRVRIRLLHARCRLASRESMDAILRNGNIGDWFILYILGKNVDPISYREIVSDLAKCLETNDSNALG